MLSCLDSYPCVGLLRELSTILSLEFGLSLTLTVEEEVKDGVRTSWLKENNKLRASSEFMMELIYLTIDIHYPLVLLV